MRVSVIEISIAQTIVNIIDIILNTMCIYYNVNVIKKLNPCSVIQQVTRLLWLRYFTYYNSQSHFTYFSTLNMLSRNIVLINSRFTLAR